MIMMIYLFIYFFFARVTCSRHIPDDFSIFSGDMAKEHNGVQFHRTLVQLLCWKRTKPHRGTLKPVNMESKHCRNWQIITRMIRMRVKII